MIKNEHVKYEINTNEMIDEIEYRAGRIQQMKRAAPLEWRFAGREAPAEGGGACPRPGSSDRVSEQLRAVSNYYRFDIIVIRITIGV